MTMIDDGKLHCLPSSAIIPPPPEDATGAGRAPLPLDDPLPPVAADVSLTSTFFNFLPA